MSETELPTSLTDGTEIPKEELSGTLKIRPFINKGGRAIPGSADCFIEIGKQSYFVRFDHGNVSWEELKPYEGKTFKMVGSLHTGLWDTDDPNVQSRYGEYIVIDRIIGE